MTRSKVRSRSAKPRPEGAAPKPRAKTRRVKPPKKLAPRRPDIYSWVLVALMLFAGTTSGTIAYRYGRRALDVVREVPAGNRSIRSRRPPSPQPTPPAREPAEGNPNPPTN